jgi:hypothetical protein
MPGVMPPQAPFLRDPVTVPRRERVEHYRAQAARYRWLAARETGRLRDGLVDLGQQCDSMADALEQEAISRPMNPGI